MTDMEQTIAAADDVRFRLSAAHLRSALDMLAERDVDIAYALTMAGYPPERRQPTGFPAFLRIVVAQQLSAKAATTIHGRLLALLDEPPTPEALLAASDESLRAVGLSRQKIAYARALAEAVQAGRFDPEALEGMEDQSAVAAIAANKGFGVWSARMYLIFALGRSDIWPADDLGVREGVRRIKMLAERPTVAETDEIGALWTPHRSAAALLCWHVLHNAPA